MSRKATEFQKKEMNRMYRGKEIFKPLNTGWIDENVACVREWVANIFFYRKGDTAIMIDASYNYDRLAEKMGWLGIDPHIDGRYLFTGDTLWFGADGGYSFISALAEDNKLAVRSLAALHSDSTGAAMCCTPDPAGSRYRRRSPCTIPQRSGRPCGSGCSGSMRTFSPTGAPIWAAGRISTTAPAAPTTASPS